MLAAVHGDGDRTVQAPTDQIARGGLEEVTELAAAKRRVDLVRQDHLGAVGARGAHLLCQERALLADPCVLVEI